MLVAGLLPFSDDHGDACLVVSFSELALPSSRKPTLSRSRDDLATLTPNFVFMLFSWKKSVSESSLLGRFASGVHSADLKHTQVFFRVEHLDSIGTLARRDRGIGIPTFAHL